MDDRIPSVTHRKVHTFEKTFKNETFVFGKHFCLLLGTYAKCALERLFRRQPFRWTKAGFRNCHSDAATGWHGSGQDGKHVPVKSVDDNPARNAKKETCTKMGENGLAKKLSIRPKSAQLSFDRSSTFYRLYKFLLKHYLSNNVHPQIAINNSLLYNPPVQINCIFIIFIS